MPKKQYIRRPYAAPLDFLASTGDGLAASGGTQNKAITGDVGIITVITHIAFKSTGPFLLQIVPSDLNAGLFQNPISSDTVMALLDRPGMLPAPIVIKGANSIRLQLTNDFGAVANDVRFTFWGYRDFAVQSAQQCN